ncbi:MAG TPA: hypothetical protein VK099_05255 [Alcanivoracaceae bacterium]|nr:hypothetical protein [Alcanivoracaceae bacterium]
MLIELKGMGSKALHANKETILKACKQHDITSVCIVYCGGVNSGLTDFISVEPAIDKEALEQIKPIVKTRRFDAASYSIVLEDQEVTLHQAVSTLTKAILNLYEPEWQLDKGSVGELSIDVAKDHVKLNHTCFNKEATESTNELEL